MHIKLYSQFTEEQKGLITFVDKDFSFEGKPYRIEAMSSIDPFNKIGSSIFSTIALYDSENNLVYHEVYTTMLLKRQLQEACNTISGAPILFIKKVNNN